MLKLLIFDIRVIVSTNIDEITIILIVYFLNFLYFYRVRRYFLILRDLFLRKEILHHAIKIRDNQH